jgi:hypothetical protein
MKMIWQIIIERSLHGLDKFLKESDWKGRENEVVNLFAHGFLAREVKDEGPLTSLSQVAIEVAVPQVTGSYKKYVRKDLVIWPRPLMTAWSEDSLPAVIMEWKRDAPSACAQDIEWLSVFTGRHPQTLGVSVCALLSGVRGTEWVIVRDGAPNKALHRIADKSGSR